jgi:hypothetical protein
MAVLLPGAIAVCTAASRVRGFTAHEFPVIIAGHIDSGEADNDDYYDKL